MCLAVPGKIVKIDTGNPLEPLAVVDFGSLQKNISLAFVPEAQVGDYVNVHVGFAISILQQEEADQLLQIYEGNYGNQ